jgi:hypothetical protein
VTAFRPDLRHSARATCMRRVFASTAARAMFSPLGLFRGLPCPQRADCTRSQCAFSHDAHLRPPAPVHIPTMPVHTPALAQPIAGPSQPPARNIWTAAEKRPGSVPPAAAPPPTKMARVGPARNSAAVATATATPVNIARLLSGYCTDQWTCQDRRTCSSRKCRHLQGPTHRPPGLCARP